MPADPRRSRVYLADHVVSGGPGALLVFIVLALLAGSAHAARVTYSEPLTIEWGPVTFTDNGQETTEETWFIRAFPMLTAGGQLTVAQQRGVRAALEVCAGRVGSAPVWRMDGTLSGPFRERLIAEQCFVANNFSPPAKPPDWEAGDKIRLWNFTLRYEGAAEVSPASIANAPTLELALLIDEVPLGEAWEVNVAAALDDPRVQGFARLSAAASNAVRANLSWAKLFLVAPASLGAGLFPRTIPLPDPARFAVPLAFGMGALAEIAEVLGPDRSYRESTFNVLATRLSPARPEVFPGAGRWFPEPESSQRALGRIEIRTGKSAAELSRLGIPSGEAFGMERVLPEVNEWAVRIGPFRRVQAPRVRVDQVRGRTQDHAVDDLRNSPADHARLLKDVATQEANLAGTLARHADGDGDFFWLPGLADRHAHAVRALERERFAGAVRADFETNRFVYFVTYAPATVSGKLGAAYNPEHGFGGVAEAGWADLVRPGDRFSLKGSWAERATEGTFSYVLPYRRSLDRRTTFQWTAWGEAGQDDHFRLGGTSPRVFGYRYRSAGIEHEIHRRSGNLDWIGRDAVFWDSHVLDQPGRARARRDAGFTLRHRQQWIFRPAAAAEPAPTYEFKVAPTVAYSPRIGWERAFWQGEIFTSVRASIGQGGGGPKPFEVELKVSAGASSAAVPAALGFRLGDTDRLFGLEPGEFSGRSYAHAEVSTSAGVGYLIGVVTRQEKAVGASPGALEGLSLQLLVEAGAVSAAGGLSAWGKAGQVISSYGLALAKAAPGLGAGGGFRLGYAWSPDSLRDHGRVFSALDWNF